MMNQSLQSLRGGLEITSVSCENALNIGMFTLGAAASTDHLVDTLRSHSRNLLPAVVRACTDSMVEEVVQHLWFVCRSQLVPTKHQPLLVSSSLIVERLYVYQARTRRRMGPEGLQDLVVSDHTFTSYFVALRPTSNL